MLCILPWYASVFDPQYTVCCFTLAFRPVFFPCYFRLHQRVAYAKAKSDVVAQRDGSFVARPKRKTDGSEAPAASAAKQSKKSSSSSSSSSSSAPHAAAAPRHSIVDEEVPPNAVLFVQNLPIEATHPMLVALFSPYDGFKEARMIEGKPGIAFVEFGTEFQSTRAMESLQGFKVTPQHAMDVSYAKK